MWVPSLCSSGSRVTPESPMSDGIFITERKLLEAHSLPMTRQWELRAFVPTVSKRASMAADHGMRYWEGSCCPCWSTSLVSLGPHRTSRLGGLRRH